jgi:hypothetical protein
MIPQLARFELTNCSWHLQSRRDPALASGMEVPKKSRWGFLKRHRPKDGIPKEEEEKPRKRTVSETLLQCNSVY